MKRFYLLYSVFFTLGINASLNDYVYPSRDPSYSNYGTLGLIQNPSARFLSGGSIGFTWTHNDPYLRGSIVAYPFDWLEAAFQYTDVNNQLYSEVKAFSGSQSLKDKSFDTKFRVLNESYFLPQIAVGLRDIGGTGMFGGEFIVANKYINNFDISIGVGWGNLNANKISNPLKIFGDKFQSRPTYTSSTGGEFNVDPILELGAHVAPTGVSFNDGEMFPEKMKNNLFIALHGSWNRSEKVGYKLIRAQFDDSGNVLSASNFITGWLKNGKVIGRPSAPLFKKDGSLLLSDDKANVIYHITYST